MVSRSVRAPIAWGFHGPPRAIFYLRGLGGFYVRRTVRGFAKMARWPNSSGCIPSHTVHAESRPCWLRRDSRATIVVRNAPFGYGGGWFSAERTTDGTRSHFGSRTPREGGRARKSSVASSLLFARFLSRGSKSILHRDRPEQSTPLHTVWTLLYQLSHEPRESLSSSTASSSKRIGQLCDSAARTTSHGSTSISFGL